MKLPEVAKENLPDFFTHNRLMLIEDVFQTLDSSGEYGLDMSEIGPFLYYAVAHMFQVELTTQQFESIFYLLDTNHSSEVGIGEVVLLLSVMKNMSRQAKKDMKYAQKLFSGSKRIYEPSAVNEPKSTNNSHNINSTTKSSPPTPHGMIKKAASIRNSNGSGGYKSLWDQSMDRVDKDTLDTAWESILRSINGIEGNSLGEKVTTMFKDFDSDGTGALDLSELGAGLKACGIRLNDRQINVLAKSIDVDGDGTVSFEEFAIKITDVRHELAVQKDEEDMLKMEKALIKTGQQSEAFNERKSRFSARNSSGGSTSSSNSLNNNGGGMPAVGSKDELSQLYTEKIRLNRQIMKLKSDILLYQDIQNGNIEMKDEESDEELSGVAFSGVREKGYNNYFFLFSFSF
jgi:Ca2+-binding EF-hand superfamily protein